MNENQYDVNDTSIEIKHPIEFIREVDGVKYYSDPTGNSPNQTIEALKLFDQRVILIVGGYEEDTSYDSLGDILVVKTKHLILLGQTASLIEISVMSKLVGKYRGIDIRITHCSTLKQALDCASLSAKPGDIVLLSPASSSLDMFKDIDNGENRFKKYINEL